MNDIFNSVVLLQAHGLKSLSILQQNVRDCAFKKLFVNQTLYFIRKFE